MSPIRRSDDKTSPTSLPTAPLPPPETTTASANGHTANDEPATLAQTEAEDNNNNGDPQIDPELASLPAPGTLSITESILQAPNPRPADFSMMPITSSDIDITALDEASLDGAPGSPTAKLMKAIAPPNAAQPDAKWAPPPPNASVNLFIGRALLSNGNDNWPLKPNDIVNWIRKHYPAEWDGDEGRCSAHRVRTYLARKGADMYYEKLSQGSISGWRIRQNHIWRFENGGFLGRGMKQEEAIAAQAKENEAIATAAHKASAAAALAAGHPGIKVSMSAPGTNDAPPAKRPKTVAAKPAPGQSRRRNKKAPIETLASLNDLPHSELYHTPTPTDFTPTQQHTTHQYATSGTSQQAGPSQEATQAQAGDEIDPNLLGSVDDQEQQNVDMEMVQRAMQAAAANAGQMEDLDMGIQLPIEMQMHGGEHDDRGDYYGTTGGGGHHPYTPHGNEYQDGQYLYNTDNQVYGHTYQSGQ